jgi:hypothetical protein
MKIQSIEVLQAKSESTRGSAMLVIMLVSSFLAVAGLAMTVISSNATYRARKLAASVQALYVAEAGVVDTFAAMKTNFVHWKVNTNVSTLILGDATGTYSVVTEETASGTVIMTSVGEIHDETRETVFEVLGKAGNDENDALFGGTQAILAEQNVKLSASAMRIYGDVHANQNILEGPGNPTVDADATAGGIIQITPTGAAIEGAPARELPEFNFDSYRDLAIEGGIYYEGDQVFAGETLAPSNGIVYVNGDVTIANQSYLYGTLVANGNIQVDNRFDQFQIISNRPALLATGHVDLDNRNNYTGIIYGGLSVESDNRKVLYGGIISHGSIDIKNRMYIHTQSDHPVWDPAAVQDDLELLAGGWLK